MRTLYNSMKNFLLLTGARTWRIIDILPWFGNQVRYNWVEHFDDGTELNRVDLVPK